MTIPNPIYLGAQGKEYFFRVIGKPWVQKNNLRIHYKRPRERQGAFIAHTKEMEAARTRLTHSMHLQFRAQGGRDPIDYAIEAAFTFYTDSAHEPDLDNLPAIVLDAMQGTRVKGTRRRVGAIFLDDKQVRLISSLKKIVKGDVCYDGEPRTELRIRGYYGHRI